jgi:acetyl-CoA carboxylase biotin carboxyl carrier protein
MSAAPKPDEFFNNKQIRRLIALMEKHDLAEVDLKNADQRVRIKRGGEVVVSPSAQAPRAAAPAPAAAPAAAADS